MKVNKANKRLTIYLSNGKNKQIKPKPLRDRFHKGGKKLCAHELVK